MNANLNPDADRDYAARTVTAIKKRLATDKISTEELDRLAERLRDCTVAERTDLIALIDQLAAPLPFYFDTNYGGALLESIGDERPDPAAASEIYRAALRLAQWCASCATSGGEGTTRMSEVRRIEAKLARIAR